MLLGATRDLVYWNWRYGYTLIAEHKAKGQQRARFNTDVGRRRLAAPQLAQGRYGELVTDVASSENR